MDRNFVVFNEIVQDGRKIYHILYSKLLVVILKMRQEMLIAKGQIVRTAVKKGWIVGLGEEQIIYYGLNPISLFEDASSKTRS